MNRHSTAPPPSRGRKGGMAVRSTTGLSDPEVHLEGGCFEVSTDSFDDLLGYLGVDAENQRRAGARGVLRQGCGDDVDALPTEVGTNLAQCTGLVRVVEKQVAALGAHVEAASLEADDLLHAVESGESTDDGGGGAVGSDGLDLDGGAMADGLALGVDGDVDAPFFGDAGGVDEGDLLVDHRGEQAAHCGQAEGVDLLGGQLAAGGDLEGDGGGVEEFTGDEAEFAGEVEPEGDLFADAAAGDIHGVGDELAGKCLEHAVCDIGACPVLGLDGRRAEVRGDHDLLESEQRGVSARFGSVDVETGTPDVAGGDGVGERLLVDEAAAGGVDDDLSLLGLGEQLGVEHAGGLLGLGEVDRDEVTAAHEFVEFDEFDAELRGACGVGVGVVGDDGGLERGKALGEELADVAEADDADGLAEDLDALEG